MNATFSPIAGLSVEFNYDRQVLTSAIAVQVSIWMSGIAFRFFGLCETTVNQGREARGQVNRNALQVRAKVAERISEWSLEAKAVADALAIATEKRIRRQVLGWVQPPVQAVMAWLGKKQNQITEVLDAYIAGAEEPLLLSAVSEEPELLVAVTAERPEETAISDDLPASGLDGMESQSQVIQQTVDETGAMVADCTLSIELANPKSRKRGKATT